MSELLSIVLVTAPSADCAQEIAAQLVKNRLAACVNIIPQLTSVYRWEGKLQEDSELLLVIKTRSEVFEKLKEAVIKIHPYDTAEVLELEAGRVSEAYRSWVLESTK